MDLNFSVRKLFFAACLVFLSVVSEKAVAQETWSLQRCILYAQSNNISLKQAENAVETAKINTWQNSQLRLPSLNGSMRAGYQFGRTVDPTTYSFENQTISFNSLGADAAVSLYSGGRINNSIKQGKINLSAALADAEATFNSMALSIAAAYLTILQAEEQLENALMRRQLTEQQLVQTDKLIAAGSVPANDRLDVLAQLAANDQSIVTAKNQVDIGYISLKGLLQLDPNLNIKVEKPNLPVPIDQNIENLAFSDVYNTALGKQPQVRAAEMRMESAELSIPVAESGYMPSLVMFGSINSNWSSLGKSIDAITPIIVNQDVYINGMPVAVGFPSSDITYKDTPYWEQLKSNRGLNFGLSLRLPIYNNGENLANVQRAKINVLNSELASEQVKLQLKTDVQQALANARAAKQSLDASQKALDASKIAFENADKRFGLGTINNLQLQTARNNYDIAQVNYTLSKYDYIFRLKILDFYLGNAIKLD